MDKTLWATQITDVSSNDLEGVGRLRTVGDKIYRWVQNKHTATLTQGALAHHKLGDSVGEVVQRAATAVLNMMAGVVVAADGIAVDFYGWVQVLGVFGTTSVLQSETTAWTPGMIFKGVDAQFYADHDVNVGTAPTRPKNLTLLETISTVTTGAAGNFKVYINCL